MRIGLLGQAGPDSVEAACAWQTMHVAHAAKLRSEYVVVMIFMRNLLGSMSGAGFWFQPAHYTKEYSGQRQVRA
jgi:hypothetical protein